MDQLDNKESVVLGTVFKLHCIDEHVMKEKRVLAVSPFGKCQTKKTIGKLLKKGILQKVTIEGTKKLKLSVLGLGLMQQYPMENPAQIRTSFNSSIQETMLKNANFGKAKLELRCRQVVAVLMDGGVHRKCEISDAVEDCDRSKPWLLNLAVKRLEGNNMVVKSWGKLQLSERFFPYGIPNNMAMGN